MTQAVQTRQESVPQGEEVLTSLYRCVSACQFYPRGHPILVDVLKEGYAVWTAGGEGPRWEDPGLQLRSGGLWLGESRLGESSPAVSSLVRVFSTHGIAGVRTTGDLGFEGFTHWVGLLASPPEALASKGGILGAWKDSPHATALRIRGLAVAAGGAGEEPESRSEVGFGEVWGAGLTDAAEITAVSDPMLLRRLQSFQQQSPRERQVVELLLRLGRTEDLTTFLSILGELSQIVEKYLEEERDREAFHVVVFLHREAQNMDALGREAERDHLQDAVRLLVRGAFLTWLTSQVASSLSDEDAEVGEHILRFLGAAAVVPLINTLAEEKSRMGRRRLVNVLVSIGDSVVPWAVRMLDDQRWFVVRNMVTILGGIGSPTAANVLLRMANDPDDRIRKEVARSLGRVESSEAEAQLIRFLDDPDPAVRGVAISVSSSQRTGRMLGALWNAFHRIGVHSPYWTLKPSILQAIGRMGLAEGVAHLKCVLEKRPLLGRGRWETIQRAAVQALGDLGGPEAESILSPLREHRSTELRTTAIRALAAAEAQTRQGTP